MTRVGKVCKGSRILSMAKGDTEASPGSIGNVSGEGGRWVEGILLYPSSSILACLK